MKNKEDFGTVFDVICMKKYNNGYMASVQLVYGCYVFILGYRKTAYECLSANGLFIMKTEEKLIELIKSAENDKKVVNTAKQQLATVLRQMPIYSGYYVMELSRKDGGTDWLEYMDDNGECIRSCRIMKDMDNGTLYIGNENFVPIARMRGIDCVRVSCNLGFYDYGKRVNFRKIGKIGFLEFKRNFVQGCIYEFYSSIYSHMYSVLESGDLFDEKFGRLYREGNYIKWEGNIVPCFPAMIDIDMFRYSTGNFIEKNSFILLKFFEKINEK